MQEYDMKLTGLTSAEVEKRIKEGKTNASSELKTKSVKSIFYDNICSLFNAVNIALFIALLIVGSYKNMLFIGIVICNTAIGIFQEIRSKRSVDKLTILSESKTKVVRNGKVFEISKEEIVLDDIIILSRGDQIPADCVVCSGNCKVNESLLTGESNLIEKKNGDNLLSGSFIAAGKCYAKINCVGSECYAAKINNEAKYIKKVNSQILKSFKFIVKICTIIIVPIGVILFIRQFGILGGDIKQTVESTVASIVGMIPGGMILLTSSVLAVSVIRLSKKKVLVNEMYCIESLARVDVLCVDKTGTLTADRMTVENVIKFNNSEDEIKTALSSIVDASEEINATLYAIKDYVKETIPITCRTFTPFSSETKWSGGRYKNGKTYIIGAAEFVFKDKSKFADVYSKINKINETVRILALAVSDSVIDGEHLPDDLKPMALILIKDVLRDNVKDTVRYFKEQGVALKVISGDSVKTVQNIAVETCIEGAENAVDMSSVTTDDELFEAAERCSVFGRVTPAQKKKLVLALKDHGHNVAMMGDGVNDVLALKEADCSVAMSSGSEAARNISQLVLVNNDFASMPEVVAEGRRTINNVERSSSLFIVKTIYSVIISIFFIFFNAPYPFEPIQLTLIGAFTIGFPSFVLALQPNKDRIRGSFIYNIFSRAIPAAFCVVMNIIIVSTTSSYFGLTHNEMSTICVFMTAISCLLLIIRLSIPFNILRVIMIIISVSGIAVLSIFCSNLFSLCPLGIPALTMFIILTVITVLVFNILYNIAENVIRKNKNQ